jgi:hypothetical protein
MLAPIVAEKAPRDAPPRAGVGVPFQVPRAETLVRNVGLYVVVEIPATVMYAVVELLMSVVSWSEMDRT